jgi:chromosome segregation protein
MGPVNMLALSEYEKEKERFDFLTTQKDDLLKADSEFEGHHQSDQRHRLRALRQGLLADSREFHSGVQELFEIGEADLRLTKAIRWSADIVIEANPKGKKLGSLALLSGGEKTLTAISLLFAIYLVKPSPFCILDEVDAPLDDMNIGRFAGALKKFSDNTQFIVVTHNKLTMKSADYLYGITMEEQGVSKVVSVKFEEMEVGKVAAAA